MKFGNLVMGFVLCLFFVSSADSANLAFKTIPLTEDIVSVGNDAGVVNFYTTSFDLNNLASNTPAFIVLMVKGVVDAYNFITINADHLERAQINTAPYSSAKNSRAFAGRLLETGDEWSMQIVPVRAGLLRTTANSIGIHSRTEGGSATGNTDDFRVTRLYLIYYVGP